MPDPWDFLEEYGSCMLLAITLGIWTLLIISVLVELLKAI